MQAIAGKLGRKGISTVVAATIMILVSIIAIMLLWTPLKNLIEKPLLSPQLSCAEMKLIPLLKIESACFDEKSAEIKLKIRRSLDSTEIPAIKFALASDGKTENWECSRNCGNCEILQPGETRFYYLPAEKLSQGASLALYVEECAIDIKDVSASC
jgi:hypothetical protein